MNKLVEALEFYANGDYHFNYLSDEAKELWDDNGKKAKQALAEYITEPTAPPTDAEISKFIYKLRAFARHNEDCIVNAGGVKCSCGYFEILGEQQAITKLLKMRAA